MSLSVRFVDQFNTLYQLPEASLENLTVDPEDTAAENAAKQLAEKRLQGCMALLRTLRSMREHMDSTLFDAMAEASRDAYLAEFSESLEDDLFASFADAP